MNMNRTMRESGLDFLLPALEAAGIPAGSLTEVVHGLEDAQFAAFQQGVKRGQAQREKAREESHQYAALVAMLTADVESLQSALNAAQSEAKGLREAVASLRATALAPPVPVPPVPPVPSLSAGSGQGIRPAHGLAEISSRFWQRRRQGTTSS